MALQEMRSSLAMRIDMAIDHLVAQGFTDLHVRLIQRNEEELRKALLDAAAPGAALAKDLLKNGVYRGFPVSITDGPRSYVEFQKPRIGPGRKAFIEEGLKTLA